MNTKIYLLPLLLLAVLFASCEETDEVGRYDDWRARNDAFIDSLYTVYTTQPDRGGLDSIHLISAPDKFIFYKTLTPVTPNDGTPVYGDTPLYTESVSTYYKGAYINKDIFDGNFTGVDPNLNFDSPTTFGVSGVVVGWTEMLQRMKVGERRLMYIPWEFGYGENDYTAYGSTKTIPGGSVLIFDMQLMSIKD